MSRLPITNTVVHTIYQRILKASLYCSLKQTGNISKSKATEKYGFTRFWRKQPMSAFRKGKVLSIPKIRVGSGCFDVKVGTETRFRAEMKSVSLGSTTKLGIIPM